MWERFSCLAFAERARGQIAIDRFMNLLLGSFPLDGVGYLRQHRQHRCAIRAPVPVRVEDRLGPLHVHRR
jgi:hypothetical protein